MNSSRILISLFLITTMLTSFSCSQQPKVKEGSVVKIAYTMSSEGKRLDSTEKTGGYTFTVGGGKIPKAIENNVLGMKAGQKKEFELTPEEGFGPHRKELVIKVPLKSMPNSETVKVGDVFSKKSSKGNIVRSRVTSIADEMVTLDYNHPIAGKPVHVSLEVLEITESK